MMIDWVNHIEQVPGHDGDFGFGGHCFPKDLASLLYLTDELQTINNVLHLHKILTMKLEKIEIGNR